MVPSAAIGALICIPVSAWELSGRFLSIVKIDIPRDEIQGIRIQKVEGNEVFYPILLYTLSYFLSNNVLLQRDYLETSLFGGLLLKFLHILEKHKCFASQQSILTSDSVIRFSVLFPCRFSNRHSGFTGCNLKAYEER